MTTPKISVVVPVYNEKTNIAPAARGILQAFANDAATIEILFVDDNSPDGTAEEVERVGHEHPQVRLVQHGKKEGIGAAHRAGYEASRAPVIMCIDADLSQPPGALLEMMRHLEAGLDMVIGSRYLQDGEMVGKSALRTFGSRAMNWMVRYLLGIHATDATHTFRAFRKEVYETVTRYIDQKGHPTFQVQFTYWATQCGFRIGEIPIRFVERSRDQGQSKLSVKKEVLPFLRLVGSLSVQGMRLRP